MKFILVHGGLHGAWCWENVVAELRGRGYQVAAPDLPGHGERRAETATLDGYVDTVVQLVKPGDVLVGTSMGGAIISLAADAIPDTAGHLVYLSAPVPIEGKTITDAVSGDSDPRTNGSPSGAMSSGSAVPGTAYDGTAFWFTDVATLGSMLYNDCSPEVQQWAFEHIQPQLSAPLLTPLHLTSFWTAKIPRTYIACLNDQTPARYDVENRVRRLGIKVARPFWASHSPFASRPAELAGLLIDVVENPIGSIPEYA